jgi:hypothetical protein
MMAMATPDDLVERLRRMADMTTTGNSLSDIRLAAAALVQLRDSEALARAKIAEQMIKIEWLERMKQNYYDETAEMAKEKP